MRASQRREPLLLKKGKYRRGSAKGRIQKNPDTTGEYEPSSLLTLSIQPPSDGIALKVMVVRKLLE